MLTIEQDEKRKYEQMKWNDLRHLWNLVWKADEYDDCGHNADGDWFAGKC